MADYVTKLELEADLDPEVIRATKINKVLKAMLKLPSIPKDGVFNFKSRSEVLLGKWNKLLSSEHGTPAASSAVATNGSSAEVKADTKGAKTSLAKPTNGLKGSSPEVKATKESSDVKSDEKASSEVKSEEKAPDAKPVEAGVREATDTVKDPVETGEEPAKVCR